MQEKDEQGEQGLADTNDPGPQSASRLAAAAAKWASLTSVAAAGSDRLEDGEHSSVGPVVVHDFGSAGAAAGSSSLARFAAEEAGTFPKCPPLTEALLHSVAKDNAVMLALLNSAQQDFGLNWLKHVQQAGLSYFMVAALDANTSALLAGLKVPCFEYLDKVGSASQGVPSSNQDASGNSSSSDSSGSGKVSSSSSSTAGGSRGSSNFAWGQEGWRRVVWTKVLILRQVVDWGFNVVFSDMDVIWMRDPLPLFQLHPHADILWSTDVSRTDNPPGDMGLEMWGDMKTNFNTGVYLLRNTPASVSWVHAWAAMAGTYKGATQPAAYNLTRVGPVTSHPKDPRVRTAWNGGIYFGVVPTYHFSNGHVFLVQKMHEKIGTTPYEVHLTWTYNGLAGKRARARDAMLWIDDDAYYSQGSFVTIDKLQIPQMPADYNNWTHDRNEEMVQFHLASIHSQLAQASLGMAMAVGFKRAFVSPKFMCYCERIWHAVKKCRMWEAQDEQFPIQCPTDYLFDPDHWQDDPDHMTPIDFREPSFLDNPRTPDSVKKSVLVIQPSAALGCTDCTREERRPDGQLVLLVPPGLRAKYLVRLLEPYYKYRVWRLSFEGVTQPSEAYAGFACAGVAKKFDRRMEHVTSYWCCRWREDSIKLGKPEKEQLRIEVEVPLKWAQTAAVLEVVHSALGIVRSPVAITATQVASRLWILWGIIHLVPGPTTSGAVTIFESGSLKAQLSLVTLLTAWSLSEIIRYSFFAFKELGLQPYLLLWLRYTGFILLYPLGVSSELTMVWLALPTIKRRRLLSMDLPNPLNFGFDYYIVCWLVVLAYLPGFPQLYTYMLAQRRKLLGGGGRGAAKAKAQ
ncbi:hypothetical protein N2152v2_003719 [Parachlorella kessleri]